VADDSHDITILLRQWHAGDQEAGEEIFRRLEKDLKKIATRCLARENRFRKYKHPLQRTDLFIENYLKLAEANKVIDWRDRGHFFAISTIKLRRFLIDYARKKPTPDFVSIEDLPEGVMANRNRMEVRLIVDQLMDELEKIKPMTCAILVARIYMGYEVKEITEIFRLPLRTVERHLHDGRKWLFEQLSKL
jgi:RNA polymerase sigma factor (TIGR02999 family)